MSSKAIAVLTVLLMAASLMIFTTYLSSHGASTWALPVYLMVVAVIGTAGTLFALRARGH